MESSNNIKVEVAFARPDQQVIIPIEVPAGTTVEAAIATSGIALRFPEINLDVLKVGIFGRLTKLQAPLRPGDRIEIYRPLIADPKQVRRKRAAEGKVTKRGASDLNKESGETG